MRAVPDIAMDADPNTGFEVGETQVFPGRHLLGISTASAGPAFSSPLLPGLVALAEPLHHRPLGFINPLYYQLLGASSLRNIIAPTSPLAQVRTDYVNSLDNSQGMFLRLQPIDVQSSTFARHPGVRRRDWGGYTPGPGVFPQRPSALTSWPGGTLLGQRHS